MIKFEDSLKETLKKYANAKKEKIIVRYNGYECADMTARGFIENVPIECDYIVYNRRIVNTSEIKYRNDKGEINVCGPGYEINSWNFFRAFEVLDGDEWIKSVNYYRKYYKGKK